MKLYYHPVSTTSRPVMLFAAESDIALELKLVDLFAGEQTQPPFAAVNPNQCVPVLEDGDFRLTESSAILKYLAERVGSPMYPQDSRHRARVNECMDWFNTALSRELCYGFIYPQVLPSHKRQDAHAQAQTIAWARQKALRWLRVLDEDLIGPKNSFVCGEQITLADYIGITMVTLGEVIDLDYLPWRNLSRWIARMKQREFWAQVNDAFYRQLVAPFAGRPFEQLSETSVRSAVGRMSPAA